MVRFSSLKMRFNEVKYHCILFETNYFLFVISSIGVVTPYIVSIP